ncbi:MAG: hypothetical protein ABWY07_11060, partial [Burkholderiales bacterium]
MRDGAPPRGQRAEQTRLAARTGGQVQPVAVVAGQRRHRQRGRHQLRTLVLHGRPAVGHRADRARVAAVEVDPVPGEPGGQA